MQSPYFLRRGFPPSENECLQTIRDVLCFTPPREPPHLYKYFRFSKCHLTPCRSSKIDQMRKTRCVKAYSFAEVLSLEVSTIKYAFNSLFAIHRIYKICTYLFFKVNNGGEISFKALGLSGNQTSSYVNAEY